MRLLWRWDWAWGGGVVGEDVMPGGRYGETRAEGLVGALERLGARMREDEDRSRGPVPVEERRDRGQTRRWYDGLYGEKGHAPTGRVQRVVPLSDAFREAEGDFEGCGGWPQDFPRAPHWASELRPTRCM